MSILINGMEMPTSCLECPLTDGHSASCLITEKSVYFSVDKRHDGCPLVPVPPHGRLIDAEYAKEHIRACMGNGRPMYSHDSNEICEMLNDCPTIIPAEEDE